MRAQPSPKHIKRKKGFECCATRSLEKTHDKMVKLRVFVFCHCNRVCIMFMCEIVFFGAQVPKRISMVEQIEFDKLDLSNGVPAFSVVPFPLSISPLGKHIFGKSLVFVSIWRSFAAAERRV